MSRQAEEDRNRAEEAKRALEGVQRDSEQVGRSNLARISNRVSDHMMGAEGDQADRTEVWGKRIGRGLSLVAFILLALWLINFLMQPR